MPAHAYPRPPRCELVRAVGVLLAIFLTIPLYFVGWGIFIFSLKDGTFSEWVFRLSLSFILSYPGVLLYVRHSGLMDDVGPALDWLFFTREGQNMKFLLLLAGLVAWCLFVAAAMWLRHS